MLYNPPVIQQIDSQRVISVAFPKCDSRGCPDSFKYVWVVNGSVVRTVTRNEAKDTTFAKLAPCPSSTIVQVTGTAFRRGLPSSGVSSTRTFPCKDAPPPPLDSIKIDTLNVFSTVLRVDSFPLTWYQVKRADSSYAMVHGVFDPKTQKPIGAIVRASTTCSDSVWWSIGDTTSLRVAQARASQWPTNLLQFKATQTFKAVDYSPWPYMQTWQGRCG